MRISDWSSDVCSSDLRTFLCPVRRPLWSAIFVEEFDQPFHHGAAKLLGVHDRHRIAIIAGDVMTDADRDQFHRRAVLYPVNHLPPMLFKLSAGIDRQIRRASSKERVCRSEYNSRVAVYTQK